MDETIGIIGKGRLGTALSRVLEERGCPVVQVAGKDGDAICALPLRAAHIVIAVSDHAIAQVAGKLATAEAMPEIVLHTSGAAGPLALSQLTRSGIATGVLHPLQTIPSVERGIMLLPGSVFALAGGPQAITWGCSLIRALGGTALSIEADHWREYHAAAVMASNYQVTLLDCALELMQRAGLDRDIARQGLASILRASTENILALGTERALTGPIARGDVATVRSHISALQTGPRETMELYRAAGIRTVVLAERAGLQKELAEELNGVLSL